MFETRFLGKNVTPVLYSVTVFPINHAVYDRTWENIAELDRLQTITWRMRIACWITKARHTKPVIFIVLPR